MDWNDERKKEMNMSRLIIMTAVVALLSACGTSKTDRALSGAGIGAGGGAAISALTGGDPLTGAVIGGAAGAATGVLTKKKDLDLGRPIWR
jgi:osmotically inducible lipoprotein OsmB